MSVSAGGLTVNTNGTAIWKNAAPASATCPAEPDPQATPVPTPPPVSKPGQPCDNDPSGGGTGGDKPDFASGCSPIVIDTAGEGFHLTSASGGVMFDISGNGKPIQLGWTDVGYHNAFLALPGPDGLVHNGTQLFGNFTPQPDTTLPNGFLALAVYDDPANGGNADGVIDHRDAVYSRLRLWIDANHDGVAQIEELHTLPELGVLSVSLDYSQSNRTDEFGNVFRYHAKVNGGLSGKTDDVGRQGYDVFLVTQ